MRISFYIIRVVAIAAISFTASVFASDGQLEINQACAVNTGCFTGDASGFPVTINQPGSYRLTGNLDLSAVDINLSGIEVSAPAVTVDLGGFQISGATKCSGIGASVSCSPASTGQGSAAVHFKSVAIAGVVKNGIVRNMTNYGIRTEANGVRIHDITAIHNGADGINGTNETFILNSVAIRNDRDGIAVNFGSAVDGVVANGNGRHGVLGRGASRVSRSVARQNARRGFSLSTMSKFGQNNLTQANAEADNCGGGICTARTRIYMTKNNHQGNTALTACAVGFHMASHTELQGLASYTYDYVLGKTREDSGSGAPVDRLAWVRSGEDLDINCNGWTTNSTRSGTSTRIHKMINSVTGTIPNPSHLYSASFGFCGNSVSVWCIEGEGPD